MVICIHGSRDHLARGVAYRVEEVFDGGGPDDWLVGLNTRRGMLFGAWRFVSEEPDD